ncbi:hypothetical protein [Nguyenibacter sp. L1]|uniref:hypothetical protein n=1 Tax=Nguyenibacter sp. L1 TaxID=3049350 RepID=UPI002B498169|nr:hypothetical protein [Nguyenibacter sp. L1]WRH86919.1 hypothetical protein QN315_13060 [Nguyenibacter sp. L1]
MDVQTIDQAYSQLQMQAQQTAQMLQTLGGKMQAAANGGDMQAREWMLDLRELALAFQSEQQQVAGLLQALHAGLASQAQQVPQSYDPVQPQYAPAPQPAPPQSGGFLGSLLHSGFGQAAAAGAAFGIGDDLIKELF